MGRLLGKRVAVLATSGVEEIELIDPVDYLRSRGAEVTVIVPTQEELEHGIQTMRGLQLGSRQSASMVLQDANADAFDALFLPGGVSPDHLRVVAHVVDFVRDFAGKPIFAISHGPQLLISARMVQGRTMTSTASIVVDLLNAGLAHWVDRAVVVDGNYITARGPHDLAEFDATMEQMLINPQRMMRESGHAHRGEQAA